MKVFLIPLLILTSFICSCKNPVTSQEEQVADAGPDQETYVGSYIIVDPSRTQLPSGESVKLIEWAQDSLNPKQVWLFAMSSLHETESVGFSESGSYKFTVKISCASGKIYSDEMNVTVHPRQSSVIEDVNLENLVRYDLKYPKGDLTIDKLALVDSITCGAPALKDKITSLKGIRYCTNLTFLILASQNISDISELWGLTKLDYVDLSQNNNLEDISPLSGLINLRKLVMHSVPVKNISGLGTLSQLKELYLMFTPITDISSLSNLHNLDILYLDATGCATALNSIEPLKGLVNLKQLMVTSEGLTDISALSGLTNLYLLNISYNNVKDLSPISQMKKLERLYIRRNPIETLSGIRDNAVLDYLEAPDCQITNIDELQFVPNIHMIGLSGNKIEDIGPLYNNSNLGKDCFLFINRNPLNAKSLSEYIPALMNRGVLAVY